MAVSRQRDRSALIEGLKERGYNANLIHEGDWGQDGYYMLVTNSKGGFLRGPDGTAELVWQHWDSPEHYEFVRDWYQRGSDDRA